MEIEKIKSSFAKSLGVKDYLHFAPHSHHPWPDASYVGQVRAWEEAARFLDEKWDVIFSEVLPASMQFLAKRLGLRDSKSLVLGQNTYEFVVRILSAFDWARPLRVLSTDSEFYSFDRTIRLYEERGLAKVERVAVEPFETFEERFRAKMKEAAPGTWDLVFLSQVFFNSGFVVSDLKGLAEAIDPEETALVIDGYHAFEALPVDLSEVQDRIFYVAGGYKYMAAGEGCAFLSVPSGRGVRDYRPLLSGWMSEISQLSHRKQDKVFFPGGAGNFWGATFDPTAWYRFNAVAEWKRDVGLTPEAHHQHVRDLQKYFLERVSAEWREKLVGYRGFDDWGNFLTFEMNGAHYRVQSLRARGIYCDSRGDRMRIGFGCYHEEGDIDRLIRIINAP